MNALDRLIEWALPRRALARTRARAAIEHVRDYEGASRGRRLTGWNPRSTNANAETQGQLGLLRDRSRDLVRNNAWAGRAVQVIAHNVVGTGIIPQAATKRSQKQWAAWGGTTQCDADGRLDFYGIQTLVMRTVAESGECLVRRRYRRPADGLTVPLQLQVLEPDFLDSTKDGPTASGGYILQGIEFDALGRRRGYWLYREHPGSRTVRVVSGSTFVPEEDIAHIYRVDRPGQSRGVPWGAAAIVKLRDLADYEDAQLLRQKLAACFTAFITTPDGPVGGTGDISETLEPGAIEVLPPGKTVEFANPPGAEGYGDYTANVLRAIAAAFGVTYEALTGNLSSVNFSSGRMGWIEFHRNVEAWQWQMLVPQLCATVWDWFNSASGLVGGPTAAATWTPPRREMIDPVKELNAMITSSRSGLVSISENIRRLGYDPETVLTELAGDLKLIDKLGLVLDIDPRTDKPKQEGTANASTT